MAFDGEMRHLASEQIQEFLDEGLSPEEEAAVREHLSVCTHCQGELEVWRSLFSDLEALPEMTPGPAFSQEVMARIELPRPLTARIRSWLGERLAPSHGSSDHLSHGRMQDYVEGLLPDRHAARAGAHLDACAVCRDEISTWERLFGSLGELTRFAPSPGFAERVMARVHVPAPAPVRWGAGATGRALQWARNLLPQSRRGWAVAGGVASAPTITVVALVYMVFSNSILTVESLATYSSWKASAILTSLFTLAKNAALESVVLFRVYSALEAAAASPLLLGAGGLAFSLLSAGALWVLYRNLLVAPSDDRYAHART